MKNLLRLEELAQFLLCAGALMAADVPWWVYLLLLLGPDIGMLGYLVSPRVGAISYNLLHHKAIAALVLAFAIPGLMEVVTLWQVDMGVLRATPPLIAGLVLYGHARLDPHLRLRPQVRRRLPPHAPGVDREGESAEA